MRLVRFDEDTTEETALGVVDRNQDFVYDIRATGKDLGIELPGTFPSVFSQPCWRDILTLIANHAQDAGVNALPLENVTLQSPIQSPSKIVCVGLNYREHIDEGDAEHPDNPVLFSKYPNSITGPETTIKWNPDLTSEVDFEVELAVIVGATAREIQKTNARKYIAGYTVANDVSARDLQFSDDQWVRGKSLDTFCPLGPSIVTEEHVGDPNNLNLWTEVNGERMQESNTGNMIFDIDTIISFCSDSFTLSPGDVILTGTPPGVGVFRDPPRLLDDGDDVVVGIENIGELHNSCLHTS